MSGFLETATEGGSSFVTMGGDVTGGSNSSTVVKVDGVSYPASPSTNTVPVVTSPNTITYQTIVDAQVSSSAAIAGTKVNPAFGSQNVSTTGTLATGAVTLKSIIFNDGYSGAITTDNGGPFTIYTDTAMLASSTNDYVITVVGLSTAVGLVYRADFSFTYQRIASAGPTIVGATAVPLNVRTVGAASTWGGAAIAIATNSITVTVSGANATTVHWSLSVNRIQVT